MKTRWALAMLVAAGLGIGAADARDYVETPQLAGDVKAGKLPPIAQRLPENPSVVAAGGALTLGKHGGDWNMLVTRSQDVRIMVVFGYARLVGYTTKFDFVPDILDKIEIEGERVFTMRLRKGHRWSDGQPFTAEDFRYFWQDVIGNKELSPEGPPEALLVEGEAPKVEILDDLTVRYSWSKPNPFLLPALAGPAPLYLYRPAHYLKRFHQKYADAGELARLVREARRRNWAALHTFRDNQYRFDNPDMPTLEPWVNTTRAPATRFVMVRNPYYHRVDAEGRQLPYFDRVVMTVADSKLIPAKVGSGESDLQARGIYFNNYTFLKENEKRNDYVTHLWSTAKGSHVALFPNLNHNDPEWRKLFRDVRFRRALSLAIDRPLINQAIYYGLALEANNSVLPGSPLYREKYGKSWTQLDIRQGNRLLDEMGLTKRDSEKTRLLPDGRPIHIIVETAGEDTEQVDILELIRDDWAKIGVKLFTKPSQREVFRNRIFAGQTLMSVWTGYENGLPNADHSPQELAPTTQQSLQWPKWGQHAETGGKAGEAPDVPEAQELARLNHAWRTTTDIAQREQIWHRMLDIHAEQVFSIGVISGVRQPVVARKALRNLPAEAVYNWDPGAQLGIFRPDTFWYDRGG